MNVIEIANLSKTFKGKKGARVEALKRLSLSIGAGEVFGFLGPNGAGKSTTIKIIMGLIRPSAGEASVMGHETGSAAARKHVGYLPENPAFYDYLNADEYLDFVGKAFGMDARHLERQKDEVLALLELKDARRRPIRGYSKGMVQRLGLAQVMIHDPDVYILDEPMSGLDPLGRALVKNIIMDLKGRGKSVFFSTHITADVESVCDRVGIILKGELKSVERVESIMTEGIVGYFVRTRRGQIEAEESYVDKNDLSSFVAERRQAGFEITLVEPKRKNLEDFFLDIVKGR
ncbi:MAG: ABC transporter ATP-binding protein [Deltaproteobacteria bacterium]|nr:ABC transporter ATP-binding protein [Deltaproteobacteria bacterium]